MKGRARGRTGFTLLEVIVTLVLFGIVAVMLGPYLLGPVSRSSAPLENLKQGISLQASMEKIVATYEKSNKINFDAVIQVVDDNASGNYKIIAKTYYKLDAQNKLVVGDQDAPFLLVKIQSLTTGEQLTTLFSKKVTP